MYWILVWGCLTIPSILASCGYSPVSIKDNRYLTHETLGFSIRLPDSLIERCADRTAERDQYIPFTESDNTGNH